MAYDDSAPAYTPGTPYHDTSPTAPTSEPTRAPRRGPLSARLAARANATPAPAPTSAPDSASTPSVVSGDLTGDDAYAPSGVSDTRPNELWSAFTTALREPGDATAALRDAPDFGARWNSRADMLGACLDEYYKLTTKFNEARALLKETEQELLPLRRQQTTAHLTVRTLEERLELHSRAELRAAYLGLAEVEMRIFRVQQEHDQLNARIEALEGFLGFLSRIISTIRTIPAEALEQPEAEAKADTSPQPAASHAAAAPGDAQGQEDSDAFEELVIDADEAAELAARGDVEVIGDVVDVEEGGETSANVASIDNLPPTQRLERPTH